MKNKVLVLLMSAFAALLLFSGSAAAQASKYGEHEAECKQYLSFYTDYYKQNDYNGAMKNWRKAYSLCPATASSNIFLHGENMVRNLLDNDATLTDEHRASLIDTLMNLFDERSAAYPKTARAQQNRKALDAAKYIADADRKYGVFKQVIETNGAYTDPQVYYFYMQGTVEAYRNEKIDAEDVINIYEQVMNRLEEASTVAKNDLAAMQPDMKNYEKEKASQEDLIASIDKTRSDSEELFIVSNVASCENLVALFTPRLDQNPNDLALIEKIVKMLDSSKDCNGNDLYYRAATSLYAAKPTYTAAYSLYRLNVARENVGDAIRYLEEAIAFEESDDEKDARFSYELARFCFVKDRNAKAVDAANKVIRIESGMDAKVYSGKAYMLIGRIWASLPCGGSEIDRAAKLWVAVDYLQRARAMDSEIADECNRYISAYASNFPLAVDAANYDLVNGQSYTVSCGGLTATTTVRTRL